MFKRDYWSFANIDKFTDEQRKIIDHLGERKPEKKIKQEYMGPTRKKYINKHNPNWYMKITPEEIERQYQESLKLMKENADHWHDGNVEANKLPVA